MSLVLHRLRAGLIYSQAFADFLEKKYAEEHREHPGELPHLDYVRCAQGELAGQSWLQIEWVSGLQAPTADRHTIGSVEVFIHRQAMRGLKNQMLHFDGQKVIVKS